MAKQDSNPPVWHPSLGDGCSGVLDWLPLVGDMTDCCDEHDRAYHYGGNEAAFHAANTKFQDCIAAKRRCWFCHQVAHLVARVRGLGVDRFGKPHFNWKGPGLPEGGE